MSENAPQSIAALIAALERAMASLEGAKSERQRIARTRLAVTAGVSLWERLGDLRARLDSGVGSDDAYVSNLEKYTRGWDALSAAERIIPQWKHDHFTDKEHDDDRTRCQSGRRTGHQDDARTKKHEAHTTPPEGDGGAPLRQLGFG